MKPAHSSLATKQPPKLLDQVHGRALEAGHSRRTAQSFVESIRRFILFHDKRHPKEMGLPEISRLGSMLALRQACEGMDDPPPI